MSSLRENNVFHYIIDYTVSKKWLFQASPLMIYIKKNIKHLTLGMSILERPLSKTLLPSCRFTYVQFCCRSWLCEKHRPSSTHIQYLALKKRARILLLPSTTTRGVCPSPSAVSPVPQVIFSRCWPALDQSKHSMHHLTIFEMFPVEIRTRLRYMNITFLTKHVSIYKISERSFLQIA